MSAQHTTDTEPLEINLGGLEGVRVVVETGSGLMAIHAATGVDARRIEIIVESPAMAPQLISSTQSAVIVRFPGGVTRRVQLELMR